MSVFLCEVRALPCRHPELMVVNAPGAGGTPDAAKA